MTTETVREAGQYQLIKGFGAGWNIFDTERQISTDWDSDAQWAHYMQSLNMDDFEAECETLIEAELEHYTECANCETHFPDDDAHTSDHYEGSTCCDDCHNEMIDLHVRCKGDSYHDWRTY